MPSTKELPTKDLVTADVKHSFLDSDDTICSSNSSSNTSLVSKASVIHVQQRSKSILFKPIVLPEIQKFKSRRSIKIADLLQVLPSSNSGFHQSRVVDLEGSVFRSVQDVQSMATKNTKEYVAKVSKSSVNKAKAIIRSKTSPPLVTSENVGTHKELSNVDRTQLILEYQFRCSGVVLKIPASICKEVLSILDNRSMDPLAFKYPLRFDPNQIRPLSMNFEFYGNGRPDYVNIRVIIELMENIADEMELFPRSVWPTTSLTMAIVDEDGHIVRGEAWTAALPNSNSGYKFEMEDFLTRTEFQKVLEKYGSLNLMMSFTHLDVQTEELFEINEKTMFGRFVENPLVQVPSPKSIELQHAVLQNGFTAFLGSQMLNRNFADGIIEVRYKADIVCFSVYRVFLAAHSPIFTSLLAECSTLIIEGFRPSVVMALLEFVYSSEVLTRDMELLTELVELSEHFQVAGLKERCHRDAHEHDVFLRAHPGQYGINMSNEYFSIGVQLQSPYFIKKAVVAFEKSRKIKREQRQETIGQESPEIEDKLQRLSLLVSMSENAENVESKVPERASFVGRFDECTVGSIYMIPKLLCDSLWDATTKVALDTDFSNENASIRIEFQKDENDSSQVCLRLMVADPDNELSQSEQDSDDEGHDESERYTQNAAILQIDPIASAALYDKAGRVIQECQARGLGKKGPELIWEIKPFFSTTDFPLSSMVDEKGELMIRVAIAYSSAGKNRTQIDPVIFDDDDTSKNLELSYLQNVMMNPFHHRILAQLGNPIFADAVLHVVGANGKKLYSISVHRIILSAFSPVLGQSLEDSTEICLSEVNYSAECVEAVIEYMYSGNIAKLSLDLSLELLRAAKELRVHSLWNYTLHAMLRVLQSAIRLYEFGISIGNASVTQVSIQYFIRNQKTLVTLEPFQAFLEAHPEIVHQLK